MMPGWLQVISHLNPLTYQVDGLRALLLVGAGPPAVGLGIDLAVLCTALVALVAVSARIYPNIAR
jgi:ABC-2 type transport system permease protein